MSLWFLGSHRSRCLWFLAHTDPTDLTDFFVGGKSHRIVRWGVGVVFGLTQIPQISLNCIDDVKSHRIVWWESGMFFFDFLIFYD